MYSSIYIHLSSVFLVYLLYFPLFFILATFFSVLRNNYKVYFYYFLAATAEVPDLVVYTISNIADILIND